MQNQTAEQTISRPWQGTVLAALNILGLVLIVIVAGIFFLGSSVFYSAFPDASALISTFGIFLGVLLIAEIAFSVLVIRAIINGKKWAINFIFFFAIIALIKGAIELNIAIIILQGALTWLSWVCKKHPFYNQVVVIIPTATNPSMSSTGH